MQVYVEGVEELMAKLKEVGKKAKPALRRGCRQGSKVIQKQAKDDAPKVTGDLRRAIKVRALKRSRKYVGTTVKMEIRYGSFVNLGTRKMKARAFLQQAVKEKGQQAANLAVGQALKELVK